MNANPGSSRAVKKKLRILLSAEDFQTALEQICQYSAKKVISPLLSFFFSTDETIKWRAVTAAGVVVSERADYDMEFARVVMRRLMWNLNDESGGIGWGSPEAMGEIMARHRGLAAEYAPIFISYLRKNGSFIENELLQRGVLWGLGRLSQAYPDLVGDSIDFLPDFLNAGDAVVRGLAAWSCGIIGVAAAKESLERLRHDDSKMTLFRDGKIKECTVNELACEALAGLKNAAG